LRALAEIATRGLRPDVVLLVDVPIAVSADRVRARTAAGGRRCDRSVSLRRVAHTAFWAAGSAPSESRAEDVRASRAESLAQGEMGRSLGSLQSFEPHRRYLDRSRCA